MFDLLYNLSVHGELLYDSAAAALPEDAPALADAGARRRRCVRLAAGRRGLAPLLWGERAGDAG